MYFFNLPFAPFPSPRPTKVDEAFPLVCRDTNFSYGAVLGDATRLRAIKDAELTYSAIATGWYLIPDHFSTGIAKISSVVGEEVTMLNAKSLRQAIEARMYPASPHLGSSPAAIWFRKLRKKIHTSVLHR